jgi:membrane fusion protein (multidrug efflux system)
MLVGVDGKAVAQFVTADRTIGDKWLVTGGLKPGDKVIVEGLQRIKQGMKIIAVPAGSKPRPRAAHPPQN